MRNPPSEDDDVFQLKRISFLNRPVNICCQNNNGPCPLLGIANVLLLRGVISLPLDVDVIASREILNLIVHRLLESNPPISPSKSIELARNQERNLNDVLTCSLPLLVSGLDVNVGFTSINDFEFTTEMAIFDLLDIQLVHGWLVDRAWAPVVGAQRYNQLVHHIVLAHTYACPQTKTVTKTDTNVLDQVVQDMVQSVVTQDREDEVVTRYMTDHDSKVLTLDDARLEWKELVERGLACEHFLATSASQLTQTGLESLEVGIRERQLCVLFQNNHFSTLFKWNDRVYRLVTDLGYRDEPLVIWEHLSDISGNTDFVSETFESLADVRTREVELACEKDSSRSGEEPLPRDVVPQRPRQTYRRPSQDRDGCSVQ